MSNTITKNQTANVGKYSYKYVDIAQIHDYLENINAKYIQTIKRIDNDDYIMTKRCFNEEWEEEWLQGCKVVDATLMGVKNPAQEQGSALTYARRYSLLMAFGLATEDDDAQSLSQKIEVTEEDANKYKFTFGKHKDEYLGYVIDDDEDYIDWLVNNSKDEYLLKCIEILTGQVKPNEEELKERLELISQIKIVMQNKKILPNEISEHFGKTSNEMSDKELKEVIEWLVQK